MMARLASTGRASFSKASGTRPLSTQRAIAARPSASSGNSTPSKPRSPSRMWPEPGPASACVASASRLLRSSDTRPQASRSANPITASSTSTVGLSSGSIQGGSKFGNPLIRSTATGGKDPAGPAADGGAG